MEAVVTFDYDAQQEDELTLRVGQVVKNVHVVDEGWAEGELNNAKGMFPDNFVELRKAQHEDRPPAPVPKDDRPPPPVIKDERAPPNNIPEPQTGKKLLRATFDYGAVNEDELTLKIGDIVEFLGDEEEGWYMGQLKGKTGVFPSNFVEELPPSGPPTGSTATDGKQPPPTSAPEVRPSKLPPPIPNDATNHHEEVAPSVAAVRTPATFGGKQVLPMMGELPLKPSDLRKRPPPQPATADKPEKPSQAPPPTVAKPKKEAPPPPYKRDRPPVMPKTQSKPDLSIPEHFTDHATGETDFEALPEHRLLDHVQRPKGPPRKPPSQSRLAEGKSPEPEEETPAAKPQPAWARRSTNTPAKPSEPPARPASVVKPGGPPKVEHKPSPPPGTAATQGNAELMSAIEALKQDFKKLRDEYRKDIDTLMGELDQERKKVRLLEVDVDRLKKKSNRENL